MLVLIAHGSNNPHWRASVENLAESLQIELGEDGVRLAYLAHTPPTLMDVAADAVRSGVKKIRVLPLFLTTHGHVDRDLRPLIDRLRKAHPTIEVEFLPPVGQHRLFRELLGKIAVEAAR